MTQIPVYGGPLKRDIVQLAYEECGQAGYEFELTPEEYDSALRRLDNMLSEWLAAYGIDLDYNFPDYGNGSPEDESGVPPGSVQVIAQQLALRVGPSIGKTVTPTRAMADAFSNLRSAYNCVPTMALRRDTPRGAGNRLSRWRGPFFTGCT